MPGKPVVAIVLLLLGPASASAPRATADTEAGHGGGHNRLGTGALAALS